MNRSRGLMFALVLGGLLAVTGAIWLLAGRTTPSEAADGPAGQDAAVDGDVVLPEAEAGKSEALAAADGAVEHPTLSSAAAAEDAPTRVLKGRALMEDGGPLPSGLAVFAAKTRPAPVLFTLGETITDSKRQQGLAEDFGVGTDQPEGRSALVELAADGRFELPASASQEWIGVSGAGVYPDPPVNVPAGEEREVELLLVRGAQLEGRLTDSAGAPLAGRRVRGATPFDPYGILDASSRMVALGSVTTDADGHFAFAQVPAGVSMNLIARDGSGDAAPEGPPLQPARVQVPALAVGEKRSVALVMRTAATVSGRVLRGDDSPVADAQVALQRTSVAMTDLGVLGEDREHRQHTDADGRFSFARVSDGVYEAILSQNGYRLVHSASVAVKDGAPVQDVSLVADTGQSISGRVLDEDGQPVAKAELRGYPPPAMVSFGGAFDRELRPTTLSTEDGSFRLDGLDAGKVRVECNASGFHGQSTDVEAGSTGVELRLGRLVTVSGVVVSLVDSEPVHSFSVVLEPSEGMFQAKNLFGGGSQDVWTRVARGSFSGREDGTFTLEGVTPGSYDAIFTARGFGLHTEAAIDVPKDGRRGLVVMLEPEAAAFGVLVDALGGTPVPGAVVRTSTGSSMTDMMNGMVRPAARARSDSAGRFRLTGLSAGSVKLVVEHPQYMKLGLQDLTLAAGEQHDLGTLRLSKGASVFGTVYDTVGSVPDVGMMVSNTAGSVLKRTTTDGQGHYRVEGLPAGTYSVMRMDFRMSTGGDASPSDILKDLVYEQVTLAENEEHRVDLHVASREGVVLSGLVTDAAGPVPGAVLTLMPESPGAKLGVGRSDKDGRYEIGHVVTGRYELSVVTTDGMGPAQGSMGSAIVGTLDLGSRPEEHHDVTLPGGVLNGVVVSKKDGHVVPEVRVLLMRTDGDLGGSTILKAVGGRMGETYSGDDGGFRFRHISGGTYSVVAGGKGILGTGASGWTAKRVDGIAVLEGKPGFTVKVEVEPAAIVSGTIGDAGGQPLSGVGVWVLDAAGAPRSVFSEVMSDSSGAYEVGDLEPGAWTLAFMDGSHALTVVRDVVVKAEQRVPLDVRLPDGVPVRLNLAGHLAGTVDVSLIGPSGPLPTRLMSLNDLASLPTGAAQLSVGTFAPGNYHLQAMSGGAPLLDVSVTLATGSGPKVLDLPPP